LTHEASYTSTSTSALEVRLLVIDELIEIVWPGAGAVGDNVALLVKVDAGAVEAVEAIDAVAV
jgi:hypothetical protein